jgi:hypothetical protein
MAEIEWDLVGDRQFEAGLDRGVFYPPGGVGIPWNGLVSVDISAESGTTSPMYVNGLKVHNLVIPGDYSGNLKAYTYPDAFMEYEGTVEFAQGVYLAEQPPKPFGLSYRTLVANADGAVHYKIHVLYNLTAIPDTVNNETLNDNVSPVLFGWKLSGVPVLHEGRRPSVRYTFDSARMNPGALETIEGILYGTPSTDPTLPDITTLLASVMIVLVDNGDGTWSATGPDYAISMLDATTFQIEDANGEYIDANNYTIRSS